MLYFCSALSKIQTGQSCLPHALHRAFFMPCILHILAASNPVHLL